MYTRSAFSLFELDCFTLTTMQCVYWRQRIGYNRLPIQIGETRGATWNNLPSDIKLVDSSSTAAFKNLYKQYLINKYLVLVFLFFFAFT